MPRTVGLVVGFAFGFIGTLASSAADPQAAAQGAGLRCFVSNVRGASTVEGASASMIVTSDGTSCPLDNWGNPDLRQEPATSVAITVLPKHGRAEPAAPRVIYTPQSGYVGEDEFAYEAKAQYPNGDPMTMRVRVKVDVRREPFTSMDVPVRVGSGIRPPQKIKDVRPSYPADAQRAGATGMVTVELTVGADGKVRNATVLKSIPLLDAAALDAVRQWEFAPTVVNGVAVPVITTAVVSFSMAPPVPPPANAGAAAGSPVPAVVAFAPTSDPELERGRQALERRQFEEALRIFKRAVDVREKRCAECYYGLALAYQGLGAAKNVIESCDRAIELAGASKTLAVRAHEVKGVALQTVGEYKDTKRLEAAEAEFRAAMALDPDAEPLHFYLGVVLMQEHHDEEGIQELKREIALRPKGARSEQAAKLIANPRRAREAYAPEFSFVTLSREFLELGDLHGKVIVLDFWGTWCPPCVQAVPDLRDLAKKHAKDPFLLIGISSDTDERTLRDFVDHNQMAWNQYWDRDRKIQQLYEIRAWPTYILIDDEGIVRLRTTGSGMQQRARLNDEINRLLKAAAARSKAQ